jgi:hydroxycarboxylate dehydrogenase B
MAIAVPMEGGRPILLDFATSAIAEGKVRVARNKGVEVPAETLIDADGRPTRDPNDLYSEPRGALLPLGGVLSGHKGGGLSLMCDLLGGAFSGGRCNWPAGPNEPHFSNNFLALVIAPGVFLDARALAEEVRNYTAFVKSSRPRAEGGEVLLPGEPEQRSKAERTRNGIPIEEATWKQLMEAGELAGLRRSELEALAA